MKRANSSSSFSFLFFQSITVEAEEEFRFFVFIDIDGGDEVGPFAFDVVKPSRLASALVDQVVLVTITHADLVLALAAGRETVAGIDERHHKRRFVQLEFLERERERP